MGLKPDFLETLANTVMEHDKLHITDANLLMKDHDSSKFNLCSTQIANKVGEQSDVGVNGLTSSEPLYVPSDDVQKPLHVQVNGFGKAPSELLSSSLLPGPLQLSPSPVTSLDGCSSVAHSLQSVKANVSPTALSSPSRSGKAQPGFPKPLGPQGFSSAPAISSSAARREVEVTRRKTVVDKIVKGKERNAFRFFIAGFDSQTPTQLAMNARRLKSTAEDKMPRHMLTRIYGEEEAKVARKRPAQSQLSRSSKPMSTQDDDCNTDFSDLEIEERVDSVSNKWSHVKAAVSYEMQKTVVEMESTSLRAEDLDGYLYEQKPSCSSTDLEVVEGCARIRAVDEQYLSRRRQRFSFQYRRAFDDDKRAAFVASGALFLQPEQVSCPPLRQMEAFARMISMAPAFAIRTRVDTAVWLNKDGIAEERRRCVPMQLDDADDGDRSRSVSKLKRLRPVERTSVSSSDSSSLEESDDERKDKSFTVGGYSEKRRHEIRKARNKRKQRRRARRLLGDGVESNSESEESLDSYFRVKLEIPKYSDVEVPKWRKLSREELAQCTYHCEPSKCCREERLEIRIARRHLRLCREERLYFEGKRGEKPSIDSDVSSENGEVDPSPLLHCSLTETERAQYNRSVQVQSGRESSQKLR